MPRTRKISEIVSLPEWTEIWLSFEAEMAREFLAAAGTDEVDIIHQRVMAGRDLRQYLEKEARDGK